MKRGHTFPVLPLSFPFFAEQRAITHWNMSGQSNAIVTDAPFRLQMAQLQEFMHTNL
jgi:hypothetical protein